jgi:hypothetical protein
MNDTKHWDALRAAGDVPPPIPETLTRATTKLARAAEHPSRAAEQLGLPGEQPSESGLPAAPSVGARRASTRRRRVLVAAGSAAAVAAVGIGSTLLHSGPPTAVPAPLASTPSASTTYPPSQALGGGRNSTVQCAVTYSPKELATQPVAFDGTVLSAAPAPRTAGGWNVTLQVNEWFRPSSDKQQFTVLMWVGPGHRTQVSEVQGYAIGDRLLISGGVRVRGDDPMDRPVATVCGFTRTYDVPTADTWRKVFQK